MVWSKPILSVNLDARSVTVPGKAGRELSIALEDLRPAVLEDNFAQTVQAGIDELDDTLSDLLPESNDVSKELQNEEVADPT